MVLEKPRSRNKGMELNAIPATAMLAIKTEPGFPINNSEAKLIGTSIKNVQIRTHIGKSKKLFQISVKKVINVETPEVYLLSDVDCRLVMTESASRTLVR